jgi:hypothetical protein
MGYSLDHRGLPRGRAPADGGTTRLYKQVLEPFLIPLVTNDDEAAGSSALQEAAFASPGYKRAVFEMTLFASDEVVRAFGDITYAGTDPSVHPMVLWARLLLAIRKSVGNKGNQLTLADMLRPTINDIDASPEMLKALRDAV